MGDLDKVFNRLTPEYLAGLFDGEGSITIRRRNPTVKNRQKATAYSLVITLTNTHLEVIKAIHEKFGGSIQVRRRLNCKKTAEILFSSLNARKFLINIFPFLIIKRDRAELAIAFQSQQSRGRRGKVLSKEARGKLKHARTAMLALNRIGETL